MAAQAMADPGQQTPSQIVQDFKWNHGSKSCKNDTNPAIQVLQVSSSTYILRQNKCNTFEAPFIYLLIGNNKALVVDSGAIDSAEHSPIFQTIKSLVDASEGATPSERKILVVHSHSHGDHTKGDAQFKGKDGVMVVGTKLTDLETDLGLKNWPNENSSIDLGSRVVTFIPIPGHQDQSIAIYDKQTQWLLTGDTLCPGVIRVSDWGEFQKSIQRLHAFAQRNPTQLILGAHIEMNSETKKPYSIGSKFQPNEPALPLGVNALELLNDALQENSKERKLKFDEFVISPLNYIEKLLNRVLN